MTDILPKNPKEQWYFSSTRQRYTRIGSPDEIIAWQQGQDETMKVLRPILELCQRALRGCVEDRDIIDEALDQIEQILKEAE